MDEAERLADRVAIIERGRLLALDTPHGLRNAGAAGARTIRIRIREPLPARVLAGLRSVRSTRADGPGTLLAETEAPADALAEITAWARDEGVTIIEIVVGDASLEETFLRLTEAARAEEAQQ
jgi:ABC-2 type transport system ATP-binding protein